MILSYNTKKPTTIRRASATTHLVGQGIHDDRIGHQIQRMNLSHQHIGRNLMELYVLQEGAQYLLDVNVLPEKERVTPSRLI